MAQIRWITPPGDLGTYPESAEVADLRVEASNPLGNDSTRAFDPRTTITGNGRDGEVRVYMPESKNKWNISSRDLPGLVRTGRFPNEENPNYIAPQNIDLELPYRGGLNRPATTEQPQPLGGAIGISSVGIILFGPTAAQFVPSTVAGKVWTLNANAAEIFGEDQFGGHPAPNNPTQLGGAGTYHYHDTNFINNDAWGDITEWKSGYRHPDGHSKIIGWAIDGYPIYGPWGYRNATDPYSSTMRMVSGYTASKNRSDRPVDRQIRALRTSIKKSKIFLEGPVFAGMRVDMIEKESWRPGSVRIVKVLADGEVQLNTEVSVVKSDRLRGYFPLGVFIEDWAYTAPQGTTLDVHNGRYCITPDFPSGTYAYFATEDVEQNPVYPYMIGNTFYGSLQIDTQAGIANLVPEAETALTYTLLSGTLPPGLQLVTNGQIYGYPVVTDPGSPVARSYPFAVRAKNSIGQIADRGFTITVNNIIPPSIVVADSLSTEDGSLGVYFDSDFVDVQLAAIEANPQAIITWSIARGQLPPGVSLDQTGLISGFAEAPPAGGPLGSSAYGLGLYDQYVWDAEGATLSRTYQFSVRVFDGINYAERSYSMAIFAKSYFRTDNILISADSDIFTADRDGYQYPTITTKPTVELVARQNQSFAFQFQAYYANPNVNVKWSVNASGPAVFDQGAPPIPDDNGDTFDPRPFDNRSFDQTNLSLPPGLYVDTNTGWLLGKLGEVTQFEQDYYFDMLAYVEIPVSGSTVSRRESTPVRFRLKVLQDITDYITWNTDADLGTIDNGAVSTLSISASTVTGQELTYSIKSGEYLRIPQGLKLLPTGTISGRTSFDYFSLDRYGVEIFFDRRTETYDSQFSFTVIAQNSDATVYNEKRFTVTVKKVNVRPYENLYFKALLPPGLRKIFRSVVNDTRLITDEIVYRPEDPYFGTPNDLRMLAVTGLRADTATNLVESISNYHYDRVVNFGTIRKAVARNNDGTVKYEVLYVDVLDYNTNEGDPAPSLTKSNNVVYANSFNNMLGELVAGIGYENKGALPDWMTSVQPSTGQPLGFVRALILAYANPGQGDKLLYRYRSSLESSGYAVTDIMNTFKFTADRYQWDRSLTVNYDPVLGKFLPSVETTLDRIPSSSYVDVGGWSLQSVGSTQFTNINSIAYSPNNGFVAVGEDSFIASSGSGQAWNIGNQIVDLSYTVSTSANTSAGSDQLTFEYTQQLSLRDEVLRQNLFSANGYTEVASISNKIRLSNGLANAVVAGTVLEYVDPNSGSLIYGNVISSVGSGDQEIYIDNANLVMRGFGITVKGIDTKNLCNVSLVVGSTVTLSRPTTNLIPSGATITMDDLTGNVYYLTTDGVTANNSSTITFTSIGAVAANFYPRMTAISLGTTVQSKSTVVTLTRTANDEIPIGAELTFQGIITANSLAGNSMVSISNTSKLPVGTQIFNNVVSSFTNASARWSSISSKPDLYIIVPTAGITGSVFPGMNVVGPGLPPVSVVTAVTEENANSNVRVTFTSATSLVAANEATVSFFSTAVVPEETTILASNATSVVLSNPLTSDLRVGFDQLLSFGLPTTTLNKVISADGKWIASGSKGLVIDRDFAETSWRQRAAVSYGDLYSIAYGDDVYVVVGSEGIIIRGTDLDSWSLPVATDANRTLRDVAYHDGYWVIVGDGGTILTSDDTGLTWSLDDTVTQLDIRSVSYIGQWIAVGAKGLVLIKPTPADAWEVYNVGSNDTLNGVTYVNNSYYTIGTRGFIATSPDAINWTSQIPITDLDLNSTPPNTNVPIVVGKQSTILKETDTFTVDWAIRGLAFDQINLVRRTLLDSRGYRFTDGDLLVFAQQEGQGGLNDGWNLYPRLDEDSEFDAIDYDSSVLVPGFLENSANPSVPNQRAGIWRIEIDSNDIVSLAFIRQIALNQQINVKRDISRLFYDPAVKAGNNVPTYSLISQDPTSASQDTRFDAKGTRFANNRDNYVEPGTLDKYIKFKKTGVFR